MELPEPSVEGLQAAIASLRKDIQEDHQKHEHASDGVMAREQFLEKTERLLMEFMTHPLLQKLAMADTSILQGTDTRTRLASTTICPVIFILAK